MWFLSSSGSYYKKKLPDTKMYFTEDGVEVHTNMRWCTICGSPADLVAMAYYQCQAHDSHTASPCGGFSDIPNYKDRRKE